MKILSHVAAGTVAVLFAACTPPSGSKESSGAGAGLTEPARLSLGATKEQALDGLTSSFTLESTPDLVLHAALADQKYEGQVLRVLGTDAQGGVVWNYPHVQKGASVDVVLPVFGSPAARKHATGLYVFEVVAPDRTVVARGTATFTSTRGEARDAGGAFHSALRGQDPALATARE